MSLEVVADRGGAADGAGGAVERGEHAVAGALDPVAAMNVHEAVDDRVVVVEDVAHPVVAEAGGERRRVDEVGEQHRGQHPVDLGGPADAAEEVLDAPDELLDVALEEEVLVAVELDEVGVGDVLGEVATVIDADPHVVAAVDAQASGAWIEGSTARTSTSNIIARIAAATPGLTAWR